MTRLRCAALFLVLSAASCGAQSDDMPALRIWVEDDPYLSKEKILAGCRIWAVEGVDCRFVDDKYGANAFFYADYGECEKNPGGGVTLAFASSASRRIVMKAICIGPDPKPEIYRTIVAHEIGHLLGIRRHIPVTCDGNETYHKAGFAVCGPAVMNPGVHPYDHLMIADHLEFETMMEHHGQQHNEDGDDNVECHLQSGQP